MYKLIFAIPASLIAYSVYTSIAPIAAQISHTLASLPGFGG